MIRKPRLVCQTTSQSTESGNITRVLIPVLMLFPCRGPPPPGESPSRSELVEGSGWTFEASHPLPEHRGWSRPLGCPQVKTHLLQSGSCLSPGLGAQPLVPSCREDGGRRGAGSPACGAVGGADRGEKRRAGARTRQRGTRGARPLVSHPTESRGDFAGLAQSVSCSGKDQPCPMLPSLSPPPRQPASSPRRPGSTSVSLHEQLGQGFLISRNSLILP